jgi:hypothetical protein
MAKARNYRPPRYVMRIKFTDDGEKQAVPALVHISGPHANLVRSDDDTLENGRLGYYSAANGTHVELPRILAGNVLDRDSVKVVVKDALFRYFNTVDEQFFIPAGSRNLISASEQMQNDGFSFVSAGFYGRATRFQDRDVKAGDIVHITAPIADEVQEVWTTVAGVKSRYQPGTVDTAVTLGASNIGQTQAAASIIDQNSAALTITDKVSVDISTADWYASILQRGVIRDTYTIEAVLGGAISAAHFRVTSLHGDSSISSITAVLQSGGPLDGKYTVKLGTTDALLVFEDDAVLTSDMVWQVSCTAEYTAPTVTAAADAAGNEEGFSGRASIAVPRTTTYIVKVTKGGVLPAAEPTSETEKYTCPAVSVTTSDGSDKVPMVRILQSEKLYQISRYGVFISFDADSLVEGDTFYITVHSSFSDISPTLVLNRNIPESWQGLSDRDISMELYLRDSEVVIPEFSMISTGQTENWAIEDGGVRLRPNLEIGTKAWTVAGQLSPLPLYSQSDLDYGCVYMTMRYFLPDIAGRIEMVRSIADLNAVLSGPVSSDNPLKLAAYHALNNGEGSTVALTAVADPADYSEWQRVIDMISERDDVFHIMPLIYGDTTLTKMFYEHIVEMNGEEVAKERVLYLVSNDPETIPILQSYENETIQGMTSVAQSVGTSRYVAFTCTNNNVDFIAAGIKAGDVIRTDYDIDYEGVTVWKEYTITEVINASEVRVDLDPVTTEYSQAALSFEVWRNQTATDLADSIANTAGIADKLVRYIYTDNADPDFDQITTAAALVGLIGSVVPHQGVSWYPLTGFDAENWSGRFSYQQLNHMGGNGVLLITRNTSYGTPFIAARHSVTTNKYPYAGSPMTNLTLKLNEEMFIRNALLILKEFRASCKDLIGVTNNVAGTDDVIMFNLNVTGTRLQNDSDYKTLGGRITTGPNDIQIRSSLLLKDQKIVTFNCELPFPFNDGDFTLYV